MRAPHLRVVFTAFFFVGVIAETAKVAASESPARAQRVLVKRTPVPRSPGTHAPGALAPAPFSLPEDAAAAARAQRSAANERWTRFISDYTQGQGYDQSRNGRSSPSFPSWAKDAVMVDLPLAGHLGDRPASVPVLVLPVPVPVKDSGACNVNQDNSGHFEYQQVETHSRGGSRRPSPAKLEPKPVQLVDGDYDEAPAPAPAPAPRPPRPRRPPPPPQTRPAVPLPPAVPSLNDAKADSRVLIELFRSQKPRSPQMPPILIRERRYDADPEPAPSPQPAPYPPPRPSNDYLPTNGYLPPSPYGPSSARAPPPPRFDRPLLMRGEITVYRADYTEPYTALWDASSGAARVDLHGGSTTSYRTVAGGRVTRAAMFLDRSGGAEMVRCAVMRGSSLAPSDKIPPVLPDTSKFTFDGHVEFGNIKAEKWKHTVSGKPGEMGGAKGEALVFRHELLLTRGANNFAMPLQYSVAVDSSVLGPDCDGYVHRYHEVREQQVDPSMFQIDLGSACEKTEETKEMSLVEPLLEFTMLVRDPRHDEQFKSFSSQFERKYVDAGEEAVRKNLFIQTQRFIMSGGRQGATFELGTNFLSDRLDAELEQLLGVVPDAEHFLAETFPHARAQLRELEGKLPEEFDWREKGGVTPVRFQGANCASCWAFAVAGAVEGALFRKTRQLVALSEQCLVDCAQPYGGRGCGGTWPSHAFDYVQDRGLPALDEYTPYAEKVQQCRDKEVPPVTQISAHVNVTQFSVPALKVAIRRHAPTVVIIDANLKSFQSYKTGIYYDDRCAKDKRKLKHAVLAVGWGQSNGEPHFILKNSWSAAWGDGGYIRLHGPSNTCGVLTLPSYPRLERDDVLRPPGGARAAGAPDAGADEP